MTDSKRKLARTRRIAGLETTRLNALIADVVRIDAQINNAAEEISRLMGIRDNAITRPEQFTIEMLSQNGVWMEGIDRTIAAMNQQIESLNTERETAQEKVLEQRTRVKGLETLLESLRFDVDSEVATEQMLLADEKALNDFAGR